MSDTIYTANLLKNIFNQLSKQTLSISYLTMTLQIAGVNGKAKILVKQCKQTCFSLK